MIVEKYLRGAFIEVILSPSEYMLINSLSLSNFKKVIISPKIITKGIIIVIRLGIKKRDKYKIDKISTWIKLVRDISLVNCSNQAIVRNIKKINNDPFEISVKTYLSILVILLFSFFIAYYEYIEN